VDVVSSAGAGFDDSAEELELEIDGGLAADSV